MKKILAAIMLVCLLSLFGCAAAQDEVVFGPTLPGVDEIYPTVLVDGEIYQWRMGRAVMNEDVEGHSTYDPQEFLQDMECYGEIIKGSGDHPEQDRELVCVFDASGSIYLDPNDEKVIYLWLTTDWFEDGVIAFDRVDSSEENEVAESDIGSADAQVQPGWTYLTDYTGYVDEILPQMYRDVTLENVQISSDDPYEGMITSIGDFNEDGITEKIVVDYRDILAEGNVIFRYMP